MALLRHVAGVDVGVDVGVDGNVDGGVDGGVDSGVDGGVDGDVVERFLTNEHRSSMPLSVTERTQVG